MECRQYALWTRPEETADRRAGVVTSISNRVSGLAAAAALLAACGPGQATEPAGSRVISAPTATTAAETSPTAGPTQDFTVRDGEAWIAFQWVAGAGDGIFLVRPDGTGRHRIAANAARSQIHPDWSPNGQQLAFVAETAADRTELWVVNADGSDAGRLFSCDAPCNQVSYPDWAPDGRSVYFGLDANALPDRPPTTFRVARYDLATDETTIVLERKDGMSAEQPRISPDSTQVVYTRFREGDDGGSAIFVADLKGGPEHRLTDWDLFGAYPDWSIEGLIVFNTRDLGVFQDTTAPANLYTIAIDGGDLSPLTTFGSSDTRATQPRWTPDGTGIVFTQVDGSGFGQRRLAFIDADGSDRDWLTPSPLDGTHPTLRPMAGSG
jgi:Tol biopolymer transport system component